jgi:hypothetical protein
MSDQAEMPRPHPDDIICGPWGAKHRGEFNDPSYECSEPECGCHVSTGVRG